LKFKNSETNNIKVLQSSLIFEKKRPKRITMKKETEKKKEIVSDAGI